MSDPIDDDFGTGDSEELILDRVDTVRTLWDCFESRNWAAARTLFASDATLTWHTSGERLRGADAIVCSHRVRPEGWHLVLRDVTPLADGRVLSTVRFNHTPKRWTITAITTFDGVAITAIDAWEALMDAPPPWRDADAIGAGYERFDTE